MNKRLRASKGGKAADHKSPLRQIVEVADRPIYGILNPNEVVGWRTVEVLECGHEQGIKVDMVGEYHAYRRRCKSCAKEMTEIRQS